MKKVYRYVLAALLILSVLTALAASSFVSARPQATRLTQAQDVMISHLVTLPEGSTHSSYDGDYISSHRTISLTSGWTTNLPYNTCAIAARFSFKDSVVSHFGALRPGPSEAFAILGRTQTANQWVDNSGIVPINTYPPTVWLHINSPGYVYIEITGYWVCDDYCPVRPTPAP